MKLKISAILVALFLLPGWAAAHAFLDHAEPRVGSDVGAAPKEIRIWFTQQIEPAFSKIQIFDSKGKQIDQKDTHIDGKDHKLLIVSAPELAAGTYKVSWHVVSVDTHRTQGSFQFTIKP